MARKMDRGIRRHHVERMKKRVASYYGGYGKNDPRVLGIHAQTRTPCSCCMCGNPRRYFKKALTIQEKRQNCRED